MQQQKKFLGLKQRPEETLHQKTDTGRERSAKMPSSIVHHQGDHGNHPIRWASTDEGTKWGWGCREARWHRWCIGCGRLNSETQLDSFYEDWTRRCHTLSVTPASAVLRIGAHLHTGLCVNINSRFTRGVWSWLTWVKVATVCCAHAVEFSARKVDSELHDLREFLGHCGQTKGPVSKRYKHTVILKTDHSI